MMSGVQIVSSFFADYVSIYERKLFVQGGVWDTYAVDALPANRTLALAVILQGGDSDRGKQRLLSVETSGPSGEVVSAPVEMAVEMPADAEHFSIALNYPVTFVEEGRHVTQVMVDGEPQIAVPFRLFTNASNCM